MPTGTPSRDTVPRSVFPRRATSKMMLDTYIQPAKRLRIYGTSAAAVLEGKHAPWRLQDVQVMDEGGKKRSIVAVDAAGARRQCNIAHNWSVTGVDYRHTAGKVLVDARLFMKPSDPTHHTLRLTLRAPTADEAAAARSLEDSVRTRRVRKRIRFKGSEGDSGSEEGGGIQDGRARYLPLLSPPAPDDVATRGEPMRARYLPLLSPPAPDDVATRGGDVGPAVGPEVAAPASTPTLRRTPCASITPNHAQRFLLARDMLSRAEAEHEARMQAAAANLERVRREGAAVIERARGALQDAILSLNADVFMLS